MKESVGLETKLRILVVDDEDLIRNMLKRLLEKEGFFVITANNGLDALKKSYEFQPHIVISDLQMPQMGGVETCQKIKEVVPEVINIILTAHGTVQSAVSAIKLGIYDYITKPFDNDQILFIIKRAAEFINLSHEIEKLKTELNKQNGLSYILGESIVMHSLRMRVNQVSQSDVTVLVEGESGTGKELISKAIHYSSKRKNNKLIIVDCTSIPAHLIESEFFGHEKGAFTDAREQRIGKFEEAEGGTVFLDEIGELPLDSQAKLLRILQERELIRIGSSIPIKVNIRIIAATNKNLFDQVQLGKFREDLFYRLNILKINVPPLREHLDDIPIYIRHFLAKHQETFGKNIEGITPDATAGLSCMTWRGNIRELENSVQRAILNCKGNYLSLEDFQISPGNFPIRGAEEYLKEGLEFYIKSIVRQYEKDIIIKTLVESNHSKTRSAEKLKISRKTLFNKMKEYDISEEN